MIQGAQNNLSIIYSIDIVLAEYLYIIQRVYSFLSKSEIIQGAQNNLSINIPQMQRQQNICMYIQRVYSFLSNSKMIQGVSIICPRGIFEKKQDDTGCLNKLSILKSKYLALAKYLCVYYRVYSIISNSKMIQSVSIICPRGIFEKKTR